MILNPNLKIRLFLLSLFFCLVLKAQSQSLTLTGILVDRETQAPISGVIVNVTNGSDPKDAVAVVTGKSGSFSVQNVKPKTTYLLKATIIGYSDLVMPFEMKSKTLNLGVLSMTIKSQAIAEVTVKGEAASATQKGDTLEMNASAFKTLKDASAEELVLKMPGVTMENGAVVAHGKEVVKIMVDGKNFFGEDPSVALKNLPADVIDKIQIFDKLSEQAQFTGFDDGESEQTINVITKKEKKNGTFGKFSGGSNLDDKYLAGGNYNIFNKQRRISVIGLLNNINQQNFTQQDLMGITTSIGGKKDGGFSIGQQNGVTTTRSTGFNYSDSFGKKINVTGSYFFNSTLNYTDQIALKDKFLSPKPDHFSNERDTINDRKFNHKIHIRFEYDIDSANTLIATPKLTFQTSNPDKLMFKTTTKDFGAFVNQEGLYTKGSVNNYDIENELAFKHKLNRERRTFSIAVTTVATNKDPRSSQMGYYKKTPTDSIPTNEYVDGNTDSYKIYSKMEYTEPIGSRSMLDFNLTNAFTDSRKSRQAYNLDNSARVLDRIDSLSNIYETNYFNNHIGMAYRLKSKGIKLSAGLEYQQAYLNVPQNSANDKTFRNILPNFLLNLKSSNSSLRILYKTSTNAPSISQLQKVVDNTDPENLTSGNPFLTQEYTHDFTFNYSHANPNNSILYTFFLSAEHSLNFIGTKVYKAAEDTLIHEAGIVLKKNIELAFPVNIDHASNIRTVFNFGFPFKPLLSKINLTTGFNYAQTPGFINDRLNRYNLYSTVNGITINSDISENIDFALSYTNNYSIIRNTISTSVINANNNPRFTYQTLGAKVTWIFWKGIIVHSDLLKQYEKGFLNFNQYDLLLNGFIGKKLFKSQKGEIKIGVFDLLNQYKNIVHTVSPQFIRDTQTNNIGRYFMLTFTYILNDFKEQAIPEKGKKEKKENKKEKF